MGVSYYDPDFANYVEQRQSWSAAFRLHYHIVFATKYRRPVLVDAVAKRLLVVLQDICTKEQYLPLAISIQPEHVHLLLSLRPTHTLSKVLQMLKGASSYIMLQEFPQLVEAIGKRALWAEGYSVDTVGRANVAQIKAYLERQDEHRRLGR